MRIYEELFIVRPDATDEEIDPLVEQLRGVVTNGAGTLDKVDKWGVRKLAYKIQKRNEGYYILLQFSAGPEIVKEVERRLRVNDMVLKHLTVRIDEKLKRIEKRKKEREKRAARKPQVAAPPPGAPSAPHLPSEPATPVPGAPISEPRPQAAPTEPRPSAAPTEPRP
jgi:small subunit ribosomal protein S6